MANLIDKLGTSFSAFGWTSLGNIVFVITIVLGVLVLFGLMFFFMYWKSFYIKIKIYEPYGQVNLDQNTIHKIKQEATVGKSTTLESSEIQFDMFKKKSTHGKYVTVKGTPFFQLFMPFKKLEPIPMEYMFSDGVHLLRLSKQVMVPIPKPQTLINVGQEVSISVHDNNQWQAWNNIMADRINNKYQDIDAQKKAVTYFVIGIVAMVLVGGFILWLIYSSINKGYDAAEKFNQIADSLVGGAPR